MPLSRNTALASHGCAHCCRANRATNPELLPLTVAAPPCSPGLGLAGARDSTPAAPTSGLVARLRRSAPTAAVGDGCRERLEKKPPAEGGGRRDIAHKETAATLAAAAQGGQQLGLRR